MAILFRMENWKDIPGTDYGVSDQGRVASRKRGGWRVLRPGTQTQGYLIVGICGCNRPISRRVHALVALAFLPEAPTPFHQINHKDGDKTNNRVGNLEWVTPGENMKHSYRVLGRVGRSGNIKLTEEQVSMIRSRLRMGETHRSIAADSGATIGNIGNISRGKTWKTVN